MQRKIDYEAKVILLGESGVGKTSIIRRYLSEDFDPNEQSNSSMNYVEKEVDISDKRIKLNIWDTIGQEKYRALSKLFLNDTKIIILVYSIDSLKSFNQLNYWYDLYSEQLGDDMILGIAGNKCDLFLREEVSEEKGREYAKSHNATFSLLSAKDNKESIDIFMEKLVKIYLKKAINETQNSKNTFTLNTIEYNRNLQSNGGCCSGSTKIRQRRYDLITKNKGILNVIFLGDNSVGKTSIIKRITKNEFDPKEAHTKTMNTYEIKYINPNMNFIVRIIDVDNEQVKKSETVNAIKNSNIYFLVFDINNEKTFEKVCSWITIVKKCKEKNKNEPNFLIVLIGNKKDLQKENDSNSVNIDNIKKIANENKSIFFITSALNDQELKKILGDAINNYLCLS